MTNIRAFPTKKPQPVSNRTDSTIKLWEFTYKDEKVSFEEMKDKKGTPLKESKPKPYIVSEDLAELVRLGQILKRPILLKGEPGSGKTLLSKAVAYDWYGDEYKKHYFEWHIKSTAKATDGMYTYDHIARLRDAQDDDEEAKAQSKNKEYYRRFGPMAKAFLTSTEKKPSILLIDEIDKADIDFPNDLLLELDEMRFKIPETGERLQVPDENRPLVFITSNDERELPEAFLRRCLFMYIRFPKDQLESIIEVHLPKLYAECKNFITSAIERFIKLKEDIEKDPSDNKRVSTSELLDWLKVYQHDIEATKELNEKDKEEIDETLKNLPLYYQSVLKTLASYKREKADS